MKPKLTIAVRRGLKTISLLAGADVEADQSNECPQYKGRELRDIESALRWIACLDAAAAPPKVTRSDMEQHKEAARVARESAPREPEAG